MPCTYSGNKRNKRPDFRPTGKLRLKAIQAANEKDRLARVAANELKTKKLTAIPYHEKLAPISASELERQLQKKKQKDAFVDDPEMIRYRSRVKLLRQIVVLEDKQKSGVVLNEAQITKMNRFDDLAAELEEMQKNLESSDEEDEGDDDESDEESDEK